MSSGRKEQNSPLWNIALPTWSDDAYLTDLTRGAIRTVLNRQFDFDFANGRTRGPIVVQGLPVELDGFLGAGSQVVYRTARDHNSREFWHISAVSGAVPFDNQRVRSGH